jgi:selenocysteine-specific elongation factor
MPIPRQIVAGTAGHIDHGKSHLVRALTGIDPDRLKEEKERGITIDIGFAHLELPGGIRVGIVDVPGHERFIKNMLAGVGGIDLVLLVIAADESIKPQTREHFDICRLLRIPRGIVTLTKADLVDPDILDLVRLEARDFVAGSFLESAPVVAVSSRTGSGLDDLKVAIAQVAAEVPSRPERGLLRLPVDRSFSIKGFGSVVTGTLHAGTIRVGDEVAILPQGVTARVRGLEVFNRPTDVALPGQRTAVNLQGVEAGAVQRGDLLSAPGVLEPTHLLDVELEILAGAPSPLLDLARVRFHHGTLEAMARVKLLGSKAVPPGRRAFAQLRLETAVCALPGDRCVIRRNSPPLTIGGAVVLHNRPAKLRAAAPGARGRFERLAEQDPAARLSVLVEDAGEAGIDPAALRARTGLSFEEQAAILDAAVRDGGLILLPSQPARYVAGPIYRALSERILSEVDAFHRKEPLQEGLPKEELRTRLFAGSHPDVFRCLLADLAARGVLRADRDRVARATHRIALSPEETSLMDTIEKRFESAGSNPPDPEDVLTGFRAGRAQAARLFHLLISRGRLVRIPDGKVFHARALDDLKRRLWEQRVRNPIIDITEFKDLSGTSRKNAIPLLEHFDQAQVTRREGNRRVILPPPGTA